MKRHRQMSRVQERLLLHLLAAPDQPTYGFQLARSMGVATGTLYPLLARLEDSGWISSWWEEPRPGDHRPRRRMYQMTEAGVMQAREELAALNE